MSRAYRVALPFGGAFVLTSSAFAQSSLSNVNTLLQNVLTLMQGVAVVAVSIAILFFTQLIFENTQKLPERGAPGVQCLLLMDEFTSIGRIEILAHAIAFMAGYNLRLVTIIQSIAQLVGVYGEHDARTLIANHACRVVFAPNELRDANDISESLGMTTVKTAVEAHTKTHGSTRRSVTKRVVEQPRPLLLAQELRTLGSDRELILLTDQLPILAEKIRYFEDPAFARRSLQTDSAAP